MSDIILRVENVSKQYRLGTFGTNTIGGDVHRWWTTKIRGKEDPFLKVGDVNDRTSKVKSEFVWALQDINFEVKRGEVLGIIGKNGAGKSTLLKLLSRITTPTTGSIESWGRMASLLEVGTGFHPELTGRENIFLNGAILGMTKAEIKRKLDEIIDFSGCALYIDTPVKRYSSGMTVRLGFAVAAFLDPEILIVDEVLAVGDAEFQKKAIGKMQDISRGEGRTVLFVSHNMATVEQVCNRGLLLDNGLVVMQDSVQRVLAEYQLNSDWQYSNHYSKHNWIEHDLLTTTANISIEAIHMVSDCFVFNSKDKLKFSCSFKNGGSSEVFIERISMRISDRLGRPVFTTHLDSLNVNVHGESFSNEVFLEISLDLLTNGEYYCTLWGGKGNTREGYTDFFSVDRVLMFRISDSDQRFWYNNWSMINTNKLQLID